MPRWAAECAGRQGLFWPFHKLLFETTEWQIGDSVDRLEELGARAGVKDPDEFSACIEGQEAARAVAEDLQAATELELSGTPTFLVNGRMSIGVLDSLLFQQVLEDLRDGARR